MRDKKKLLARTNNQKKKKKQRTNETSTFCFSSSVHFQMNYLFEIDLNLPILIRCNFLRIDKHFRWVEHELATAYQSVQIDFINNLRIYMCASKKKANNGEKKEVAITLMRNLFGQLNAKSESISKFNR